MGVSTQLGNHESLEITQLSQNFVGQKQNLSFYTKGGKGTVQCSLYIDIFDFSIIL